MSPDQNTPYASEQAPSDGRVLLDASLLKKLRKARGLSQEALAELCFHQQLCVSIASIKRAETGKVVLYRTARHLAQVYGVTLESLVASSASASMPADVPQQIADFAAAYASLQPAAPLAEDIVRYVVMLHIELSEPPDHKLQQEVGAHVLQFGGRVESVTGAQLWAVFGLPRAYRSDAERAVRCALELNRLLLANGGRAMAIRLARWEHGRPGRVEGALPDLRLPEAAARPIRLPLYVSAGLVPQLDGRFLFDTGPRRFPGYIAFSRAAAGDAAALPALIGRYSETRQFKAVVEAMLEAQSGSLVYLRAMAGVGKSRLAQEFAEIARQDGMRCHSCEVADAGADNWRAPLEQLARSLFGISASSADAAQVIEDTVATLRLPQESAMFFRALCGVPLETQQTALYGAMSHEVRERGLARALEVLVLRLAVNEPLQITVEDVHWGEPHFFDALAALLSATREAPVLWVLTSRVDDDPLEAALRPQLYDMALTVFDLGPMSPREAVALADQYSEVDPAFRRQCVERAQGNPLFLTQLLANPGDLLPDSLKHLIQARLDTLPPEHSRALRMASVLGNRFELAQLRAALGEPEYTPPASGRNSLLRPAGAGRYAFVHDLVMHCIYESIEGEQQQRMHAIAADLFREHDAAQCAQHLYRASDPGALDMMLTAIQGKLSQHEYEAALDLTRECNKADSTSFSSFPLALLRAHASAGMGQMGNARQYYQHAMMLAGRPEEKIDAVVGLATTLNILEELEEEERLLDETVPLAMSIGAEAALGKLLYLKGNIYFPRGDYSECRRYHEDAARYAQASDMAETRARALSGVGDSYYAQGRMRKANELFSECLSMCEQHSYLHIEAANRSALGSTRIYLGESERAVADALASADIARKVGNRRAETFARMTAGWALVSSGQADAAHEQVESGLELARSLGSARFETFLRESQARITWQRGDHDMALRQILAVAEDVERHKLQNFIGPWVMGTLALFARDAAVRKRALLKGASYFTRDCLAHNAYRFYLNAAEVSLLDGDFVSAEFYAEQLAACGSAEPCTWVEHHVQLIRDCAQWQSARDEAAGARLSALRAQGAVYGFTQAAPLLYGSADQ
ncbi:ATP-binding protein [Pseudoduganella sp. UC29_106]|uniref:ATP-binding protein n=1 Tax=Pseudoduganella sp. UC29_106 TaxID=3374553 RepID=UPI0037575516